MDANFNLVAVEFNPFEDDRIIDKVVLLNESQKEIWLSCVLGGDAANLAYNESVSLNLKGEFNPDLFLKAIRKVVSRHEALRSTVSANGETLIIYKESSIDIAVEDISMRDNKKDTLYTFVSNEMQKVFDLQTGPLMKLSLHKLSNSHHYFTVIMHHIIGDGWSIGVFLEELSKVYNAILKGESSALDRASQISEYANEMIVFNQSSEYENTLAFWLNMYKEEVPVLNLPIDYPRPNIRTYPSNRFDQTLSLELIAQIKKTGAKSGCSLVTTLLSAFEVFIYMQTNQKDLVIGLPASGQAVTERLDLIGHCVNLLPLRTTINSEIPFTEYLQKRKIDLLDAFDHQQITFGQLVKSLNIRRDSSRIPLLSVIFNVDMGMDTAVRFDNLEHHLISNPRVSETFEIFLNITGSLSKFSLEWSYNTQLFKAETIEKMAGEFESLLNSIVQNPFAVIKDLSSKNSESLIQQLKKWNDTAFIYDKDVNMTKLIDKKAIELNDKIAISFLQEKISYMELMKSSNQFANYLLANGVKTGDIIGLVADRSIKMVVSMLGILKAGATYLPLDPNFPKDRIEYMLADSNAKAIVVSKAHQRKFQSYAIEFTIEEIWLEVMGTCDLNPDIDTKGIDLAYILYTSGSTGKPKGVKILHQSLVNLLVSLQHILEIKESDKLLAITTISFDIAALELFLPLIGGAEFLLCDTESAKDGRVLLELIEKENITMMQATPSTWRMMVDSGWQKQYKELKIISGGESLNKDLATRLLDLTGEVWNIYAPTETTIYSIAKKIDKVDECISIGRPIYNTQVYILDSDGHLLPPGSVGEICIGGDGLSSGYLNLPGLTNKVFIEPQFNKVPYSKIYKTGDLGMFTKDGEIVCMGRMDQQVKIRGHRIELGEIESLLNAQGEIRQSVVIAHEDSTEDKKLIAYIVLNSTNNASKDRNGSTQLLDCSKEKWILALKNKLPDYMVPYDFIILDDFPFTPNNKIDKKALPKPKEKIRSNPVYSYQNKYEKIISEIWTSVLNIDYIDPRADFFELGGHSLLAIKIMVAIEKATGKRLPLSALFENSTIEGLAKKIISDEGNRWNSLVAIKTTGNKTPIYLIHGGGLNVLVFNDIAKYLDKEQPVYALQALGLNGDTTLFYTIEEIASKYISEILEQNQNGPYLLAGYSLGGKIAYEMAKQFLDMGKEVKMLGIFDTYNDLTAAKFGKVFQKIARQFKKLQFILNRLIRNPGETINYQAKIAKTKIKNGYSNSIPTDEVFAHNPEIAKSYDIAYENYKTTPIDLKIDLFRVKKRIYYLDDPIFLGWKREALKGVEIHEVPGDHRTFLLPPNDREFGEILQDVLNKSMK